ncbi:glucosyltransferase domain-containing protein [Commensalibacter papalotli (ex Servin-Garciduenas et al. 2014)]|uniref:Glycosyltransferase RgtA/B/C/D-like domain-containing protein n=1 Tax=Commensalibacter papalotli (ex Servin-Garciduenas et al. 2014) TaxID=1208583 RepID=W7DZR5_9PROT|nr:glucosyltransferase domain-containing protein [Commensalibacter papalotli (ex Servin-Garciduenas et al. 2014)]EUK18144.1 hypothetical protein COMX_00300 [Commensalibacter papalotli (ex Servin-Garciduenas et al. 2014)]
MQQTNVNLTLSELGEKKSILYCSIISFLLFFLSCGRALFSAYTPDDYLVNVEKLPLAFFLQQGRFVQGTISVIFNRLNLSLTSSGFAFEILFFASVSLSVSCFLYYLSNKNHSIFSLLFASALIVTHPIFSTLADYHQTVANYTVAFLCLSSFFYFSKTFFESKQYKYLIFASIALTLTCGAYQPCLSVATIWCLFYAFVQNINYNIRKIYIFFSPIICGILLYIIVYAITKNAAGLNNWDSRVGMIPISQINHRLHDIMFFIPSILWKDWWIIPASFTSLLSLIVIITITNGLILSFKKYLLISVLFVISLIIVIAPISIVRTWDPTHRSLLGYSFCYGLVLIFIYRQGISQKIIYALSIIAITYAIIISNSFLTQVEHSNNQDQWVSSHIAVDILKHTTGQKIIIVNKNTINSVDWSYKGLFYTYTGKIFDIKAAEQQDINFCKNSPKWPKDGYLHITNDQLTLCLD